LVAAVELSAVNVTAEAYVAEAAFPVHEAEEPLVFWFPAAFTPGRVIAAEPSKLTPPIVRAVASLVAVAALPVSGPEKAVAVTVPTTCNAEDGVMVPIPTLPSTIKPLVGAVDVPE
jgi:hypothetical protein